MSYNPELANYILERVSAGDSLLTICADKTTRPDIVSRLGVYRWIWNNENGFADEMEAARKRSVAALKDKIAHLTDIDNIATLYHAETVVTEDGETIKRYGTHSANVAAHQLVINNLKWRIGLYDPQYKDDCPIKFKIDAKEPAAQINEIVTLAGEGKLTLSQAQKLCEMIYRQVELLQLPKLLDIINQHTSEIERLKTL